MHTAEWLFVLQSWRARAFVEGRFTLLTSLVQATQELSYTHWCESGMDPKLWAYDPPADRTRAMLELAR